MYDTDHNMLVAISFSLQMVEKVKFQICSKFKNSKATKTFLSFNRFYSNRLSLNLNAKLIFANNYLIDTL